MGYNSTIVICNDLLSDIANDQNYGKKISEAVGRHWTSKEPVSFGHSSILVAQHHANTTSLILAGTNNGQCLGFVDGCIGYKDNDKLKIKALKEIAKSLGYRLVKMSDREQARNVFTPYIGNGCSL